MQVQGSHRERVVRAVAGAVVGGAVGVVTAAVAGGVVLVSEGSYEATIVFAIGAWALGMLGAAVGLALGAVARTTPPVGRMAVAAAVTSASALVVFALEAVVAARLPQYAGGIPTLLAFAVSPLVVLGRVWRADGDATRAH